MNRSIQLQNYLDSLNGVEFNWEQSNCCHFVCKWVKMITGTDPMTGLKATTTFTSATRLIRELGGDLESAFTKQYGNTSVDAMFAQIGDVVLVPNDVGNGALGICAGLDALFVGASGGISRLNMKNATRAWRV